MQFRYIQKIQDRTYKYRGGGERFVLEHLFRVCVSVGAGFKRNIQSGIAIITAH